MVSRSQTSAAGALALLSEPEHVLKQHALLALNTLVPQFWAEISEHIALMCVLPLSSPRFISRFDIHSESLYETSDLPKESRDLAALLASKVYYFLGEYDEALSFALGAESAFEAETQTPGQEEYVETVICVFSLHWIMNSLSNPRPSARAIDRYIQARTDDASSSKSNPRLDNIIENIFKRCIDDGEHKQVRAAHSTRRPGTPSHILAGHWHRS